MAPEMKGCHSSILKCCDQCVDVVMDVLKKLHPCETAAQRVNVWLHSPLSFVSISPMTLWSLDTHRLSHLWPYALHSNEVNKVDFKCLVRLTFINHKKKKKKIKNVGELAGEKRRM